MAHAENDGVFVAVHLTEPVLSEGACAALRVEKISTQHTRNLFLRHNGREALTSWLDISTWISSCSTQAYEYQGKNTFACTVHISEK